MTCLKVEALKVAYGRWPPASLVLDGVGFEIARGESMALVGESGSGKSTVALAIMGLLEGQAKVTAKSIELGGTELTGLSPEAMRAVRGRRMAMVFQDPFQSLNPALTIGTQVAEPLRYHGTEDSGEIRERVIEALAEVALPNPEAIASAYPHQLSGGMRQRVLLAQAMIGRPELLICDEPTTALDVTVEAQILTLIERMRERYGVGILFVSHNLAVVNRIADRACVLYAGRVLETSGTAELLRRPLHPYTRGLIRAVPNLDNPSLEQLQGIQGTIPNPRDRPAGCVFAPRCRYAEDACGQAQPLRQAADPSRLVACWKFDRLPAELLPGKGAGQRTPPPSAQPLLYAKGIRKTFAGRRRWSIVRRPGKPLPRLTFTRREVRAVDVDEIAIYRGETLALVGESGSGKSTLGQCLLRLIEPDAGQIVWDGVDLSGAVGGKALSEFRAGAQIVFQDTSSSLNPRQTIGAALARTLKVSSHASDEEAVAEALTKVGLSAQYSHRYPHQLSGGERQRVGIARALAMQPKLIVCDEPVSALDVSVQANIVHLLADLRQREGLSYLFISHDLAVVATLSDRIAVLFSGTIVEMGRTDDVLKPPFHPYTKVLLSSVPRLNATSGPAKIEPTATKRTAWASIDGCPFRDRCAHKLGDICDIEKPPLRQLGAGHAIRCHHPAGVGAANTVTNERGAVTCASPSPGLASISREE